MQMYFLAAILYVLSMKNETRKIVFTDAVMLAAITAWAYALSFAYQAGRLSVLDIPWEFADISLLSVLQSVFVLSIIALLILLFSEITLLVSARNRNDRMKLALGSMFFSIFFTLLLVPTLVVSINPSGSILTNSFITSLCSGLVMLILFLLHLFLKFRSKRAWNILYMTSIFYKSEPKLLFSTFIIFLFLVTSFPFAYSTGKMGVFQQRKFLSFNTGEKVFLIVHKWEDQFFVLSGSDGGIGCNLQLFPIRKIGEDSFILKDVRLEKGIESFCPKG